LGWPGTIKGCEGQFELLDVLAWAKKQPRQL